MDKKQVVVIGIVIVVIAAIVGVMRMGGSEKPENETMTPSVSTVAPAAAPAPLTIIQQTKAAREADVLAFTPSQASGATAPTSGSWFSLELTHGFATYVGLQPGPQGGVVVGKAQASSVSHAGPPGGQEKPGMDMPWMFFGSTGMHYTVSPGIHFTKDNVLDFSTWRWTWNGIKEINMGGGKLASFRWSGKYGDPFTLDYSTLIPEGDPSGFGGRKYTLHMEGVVKQSGS